MSVVRVWFESNEVMVDTVPFALIAGAYTASFGADGLVSISRIASDFAVVALSWSDVADANGNTFPTSDAAMAYLAAQLSMRRPVGSPLRTVAVAITEPGQTSISLANAPPPVDVNSLLVLVNGWAYRAPASFSASWPSALLTWAGGFDLLPGDDVVLRYI